MDCWKHYYRLWIIITAFYVQHKILLYLAYHVYPHLAYIVHTHMYLPIKSVVPLFWVNLCNAGVFCISYRDQRVLLEIIMNVLVRSFLFIWIPMLWNYAIIQCLFLSVRGSTIWRLKTVPALKGLNWKTWPTLICTCSFGWTRCFFPLNIIDLILWSAWPLRFQGSTLFVRWKRLPTILSI